MTYIQPINTSLCLQQICETNFKKLFALIPDLRDFETEAQGETSGKPDLYLKILDRSPYTLTIELSHKFNRHLDSLLAPQVKIRIYLDAEMVEVLCDHARDPVAQVYKDPGKTRDIMHYKWRLNYFLNKWLDHCLKTRYIFRCCDHSLA